MSLLGVWILGLRSDNDWTRRERIAWTLRYWVRYSRLGKAVRKLRARADEGTPSDG